MSGVARLHRKAAGRLNSGVLPAYLLRWGAGGVGGVLIPNGRSSLLLSWNWLDLAAAQATSRLSSPNYN